MKFLDRNGIPHNTRIEALLGTIASMLMIPDVIAVMSTSDVDTPKPRPHTRKPNDKFKDVQDVEFTEVKDDEPTEDEGEKAPEPVEHPTEETQYDTMPGGPGPHAYFADSGDAPHEVLPEDSDEWYTCRCKQLKSKRYEPDHMCNLCNTPIIWRS